LDHYPRIYFACHTRHVRDPESGALLSAHQVSILDHLSATDAIQLSALAEHMGVTASTMSLAVDRLESGGYVRRSRDKTDKRRLNLLLTQKGLKIREAHSVLDVDKVTKLLGRLRVPEREAAIAGLALLARAAEEQMAEQSKRGAA